MRRTYKIICFNIKHATAVFPRDQGGGSMVD